MQTGKNKRGRRLRAAIRRERNCRSVGHGGYRVAMPYFLGPRLLIGATYC